MSGTDGGYLTDVEYTGDFFPQLAPAWLAYIAAINGYAAPPLSGGFTWCELGCGKGLTTLLLAATHPTGDFHACDFNPAHIEYAERLRRAAGVSNAHFHPRSFAQMLDAELPAFDFIVLHGVYSWVPDAVRGEIRALIRRRLKPGGLVLVSYNALPGWAHIEPIRRMMRAWADGAPGDSLDKARAAFAHVEFLAQNGAGYFATLPAAAAHLERIREQDIRYVAHEYLTPHGDPFYFAEVAAPMRAIGLAFAGSMTPADNYPDLMVPEPFRRLLAAAPDRAALETQRDFVLNTSFRQDLYAAQPQAGLPDDLPLERLGHTAFCLTGLPDRLPLKQTHGALDFDLADQAAPVRAIHAFLATGPALAADIHRAAGTGAEGETSFLIQQLVVAGHLAPCTPVRAAPGWMSINSVLVEAGLREQRQRIPLASPAIGSATYTEIVHAAAIEATAGHDHPDDAAGSVLARLRAFGHPVDRLAPAGEARPATDAEVLEHVATVWRALHDPAGPDRRLLRLLGVLA